LDLTPQPPETCQRTRTFLRCTSNDNRSTSKSQRCLQATWPDSLYNLACFGASKWSLVFMVFRLRNQPRYPACATHAVSPRVRKYPSRGRMRPVKRLFPFWRVGVWLFGLSGCSRFRGVGCPCALRKGSFCLFCPAICVTRGCSCLLSRLRGVVWVVCKHLSALRGVPVACCPNCRVLEFRGFRPSCIRGFAVLGVPATPRKRDRCLQQAETAPRNADRHVRRHVRRRVRRHGGPVCWRCWGC
jgi:hypothetical protein